MLTSDHFAIGGYSENEEEEQRSEESAANRRPLVRR